MKEKFNQLIFEVVKPLMKQNGFTKNGMNFYKKNDDLVFLLNFQNSQGNTIDQTKFYINCGIHSTAIDKVIGKPEILESKEYECYFKTRISSITNSADDGYFITNATDLHTLYLTITKDLKTVLAMYDNVKKTSDLTDLMINKNGLNNYRELFEFLLLTNNQTDTKLLVKRLHNTFGNERRWKIFEDNLSELLIENKRKETINDILNEE